MPESFHDKRLCIEITWNSIVPASNLTSTSKVGPLVVKWKKLFCQFSFLLCIHEMSQAMGFNFSNIPVYSRDIHENSIWATNDKWKEYRYLKCYNDKNRDASSEWLSTHCAVYCTMDSPLIHVTCPFYIDYRYHAIEKL